MEYFERGRHVKSATYYIEDEQIALNAGVGKRFNQLVDQAVDLQNNSECVRSIKKSEEKFKKALFAAKRNQYAKSAVFNNLSQLYCNHYQILDGGVVLNLEKSISCLNKALAVDARKQFGHKYASSLSKLGNVYRRCAMEPVWPEESQACLAKARELNERALEHSKNNSPYLVDLITSSEIYFNDSAVAFDSKDVDGGCERLKLSYSCFKEAVRISPPITALLGFSVKQHLCICYSRLDYFGEGKYQSICDDIMRIAPDFGVSREEIIGTMPIGDISDPEWFIEFLYLRAKGNGDYSKLGTHIVNLLNSRRDAGNDQQADRIGWLAQMTASKLARLLCESGKVEDAIVGLEYTSALRYSEAMYANWFKPKNKTDYVLQILAMRVASIYYEMGQWCLAYKTLPKEERNKFTADIASFEYQLSDEIYDDFDRYFIDYAKRDELLKRACIRGNFIERVLPFSKAALQDFHKINTYLSHASRYLEEQRLEQSYISLYDFTGVLEQYPELVLVKIDFQTNCQDLLVITCYRSEAGLQFISESIPLDSDFVNQYVEFSDGDALFSGSMGKLDFIDWDKLIPEDKDQVAILPSYFAAKIPWCATGKVNRTLLDICQELIYLPSILQLRYKNQAYTKRTGTLSIDGGGTSYKGISAESDTTDMSKDSLLASLKRSTVFSYIGHCEYQTGARPSLCLEEYNLYDLELSSSVKGIDRIELWACESGKTQPHHILGTPVNEPFGMDMEMLKKGCNTAIGTLWRVPELPTRKIRLKYQSYIDKGKSAANALLLAQKWWINAGADEEVALFDRLGFEAYLNHYNLGDKDALSSILGPMTETQTKVTYLEQYKKKLVSPEAWAGFRFCGYEKHSVDTVLEGFDSISQSEVSEIKSILKGLKLESGFV